MKNWTEKLLLVRWASAGNNVAAVNHVPCCFFRISCFAQQAARLVSAFALFDRTRRRFPEFYGVSLSKTRETDIFWKMCASHSLSPHPHAADDAVAVWASKWERNFVNERKFPSKTLFARCNPNENKVDVSMQEQQQQGGKKERTADERCIIWWWHSIRLWCLLRLSKRQWRRSVLLKDCQNKLPWPVPQWRVWLTEVPQKSRSPEYFFLATVVSILPVWSLILIQDWPSPSRDFPWHQSHTSDRHSISRYLCVSRPRMHNTLFATTVLPSAQLQTLFSLTTRTFLLPLCHSTKTINRKSQNMFFFVRFATLSSFILQYTGWTWTVLILHRCFCDFVKISFVYLGDYLLS